MMPTRFHRLWPTIFLALILTLTGCGLLEGSPETAGEPTQTPPAAGSEAAIDSPPVETPPLPPSATSTPEASGSLIVWLVSDIAGGSLLQEQIVRYVPSDGEIGLTTKQKIAVGPGGIQSYLQTAPAVAPEILPDLALIPASMLPELVASNQVYPLDTLVAPDETADLFPAARQLGEAEGQLFGFPQAVVGLNHVAFNPAAITTTLPLVWSDFISSTVSFAFPGGGPEGMQLLLQLYLAEGGTLTGENGSVRLEQIPLERALTRLQEGLTSGVISRRSDTLSTQAELWASLQSGEVSAILTSSQIFRQRAEQGEAAGFTSIPGPGGALPPQVTGWVWVITTPDPNRQQQAADVLSWLTSSSNLGAWTQRSLTLPSRRSAFEAWPDEPYTTFAQEQMERAALYPTAATRGVEEALAGALRGLLAASGGTPPSISALAETAVNAVP